jgi:ABC-2 type transport system ATP-binding protein
VAKLSGGQRAQVGLGLALAKRPRVLLLDEPVAALDPLARREFLASLTEAVAEGALSVILSSHLLHDLERVCDHLILLAASRTQLCDDIDDILLSHRMLVGPRRPVAGIERTVHAIKTTQTTNQTRLLSRVDGPVLDPTWEVGEVGLEEIILAYMGQDVDGADLGTLSTMGVAR